MRSDRTSGLYAYFALACAITWVFAAPTALAWSRHGVPSPGALACAGLSAFGPLFAVLIVARKELRVAFGRWRTHPGWILLALVAPAAVHLAATLLFAALFGPPAQWFHPPSSPEQVAALVVFPLGEEFGWRGYAHGQATQRYGLVRGSLLVGVVWGVWHLAYSITPQKGGFDAFTFALTMAELPLYALLIAWLFERSGRSMAVALAVHAGAHLDHIELARDPRLHAAHLAVLAVVAAFAAKSLSKMGSETNSGTNSKLDSVAEARR